MLNVHAATELACPPPIVQGSESACSRFIYADGSFTTLDIPGAIDTSLNAMNNHGDIAGLFYDQNGHGHGFIRAGDISITLDGPGASFTEAWGLSEAGTVIGEYEDSSGRHGFIATPTRQ